MNQKYISNKDESVRMFKSGFIEWFSHVHPIVPHVVWVPMLGWMGYLTYRAAVPLHYAAALLLFGFFVWTFAEYVLHRTVFHFHPKSGFGKRMWFIIHGVHHDYPRDSRRLVMPPALSIPIGVFFWGTFRLLLGPEYVSPFFAGFVIGYLAYDSTHFIVHHYHLTGRIGLYLKQQHLRHHYLDPETNFGVSTPIWDFVFGTYSRKKKTEPAAPVEPQEAVGP